MSLAKPPRLECIFQKYDPPLYFVTICSASRSRMLAADEVHRTVVEYGERGVAKGVALGRYVIMPDHVHLFVRGSAGFGLGIWVRGLKRVVAAAVIGGRTGQSETAAGKSAATTAAATTPDATRVVGARNSVWQRGFFDHVLRSSDSYAQKWHYVRDNAVRAGLVSNADEWPYQGKIVVIDRI